MNERFGLSIPHALFEAMIVHARTELPAECCGILAGSVEVGVGRVTEHYPLVNALNSPTEYESEPRSMLAAHKAMRASGSEILAVYHSHPGSDPIPSKRDLERNYGECVVHVIIGLRSAEADVRGWWLTLRDYREAEWNIDKGLSSK